MFFQNCFGALWMNSLSHALIFADLKTWGPMFDLFSSHKLVLNSLNLHLRSSKVEIDVSSAVTEDSNFSLNPV